MYEYIKGLATELTPAYAVIESNSIGYMLNISLATFEEIQRSSGELKLLIHEVIREDSHLLYGFFTARERELFRLLIGVSGVGPNTAILILSSLSTTELESVINSGDHTRLKNVKGIGVKTAQRIIVDLKDKIKPSGDTLLIQAVPQSVAYDEAMAALMMLGFPKPQTVKALTRIFKDEPHLKVEQAIKKALAML